MFETWNLILDFNLIIFHYTHQHGLDHQCRHEELAANERWPALWHGSAVFFFFRNPFLVFLASMWLPIVAPWKCSSSLTTIAGLGDEVLIPTEGTVEVSSPSANPVAESALSTGADYNDLGSFTTSELISICGML